MTLTASALMRDIAHVLHGAEPVAASPLEYINMAGHHLVNTHDWVHFQMRTAILALRGTITFSDGTWDESELELASTGAFADYTWLQGDEIKVISGTGVIVGRYKVVSRTDDDKIKLASTITDTAGDLILGDIEVEFELTSVAVPADFQTIIALTAEESLTISVHQTSLEELLRLKTNEIQVTSSYYYAALVYAGSSATDGGTSLPVLDIWPAPATNDIDAFTMYYRAGWRDVVDDNRIVSLPDQGWMDSCFRQLVRVFVKGYEHDETSSLAQLLAEWETSPITQSAMERDGMQQQHFGPLRGGAVDTRTQGAAFVITTPVAGPS